MEKFKIKKIIIIILSLLFLLGIAIYICFFKGLKSLNTINDTTLKNKAIVLYSKKHPLEKEMNKNLKEFAQEYMVDMYKVKYDDKLIKYNKEQGEKFMNLSQKIEPIEKKIISTIKTNNEFNELNNLVITAVNKKENKKEIDLLINKTKLSEKDINDYINLKKNSDQIILSSGITEDILPCVIVIKEKEENRIMVLPSDKKRLEEKLIYNNIGILSKQNQIKEVDRMNMKKNDFIVLFGNSFNNDVAILNNYIKTNSKKNNYSYYYVDLTTLGNQKPFEEYLKKNYLSKPISTTPTLVSFKNGKENYRFIGMPNNIQLDNFINTFIKK